MAFARAFLESFYDKPTQPLQSEMVVTQPSAKSDTAPYEVGGACIERAAADRLLEPKGLSRSAFCS